MTRLIGNPRVPVETVDTLNKHYWEKLKKFSKMEPYVAQILLTFANTFMSSDSSLKLASFKVHELIRSKRYLVAFANEIRVLLSPLRIYSCCWELVINFLLPGVLDGETQKAFLRAFSTEKE